MSESPLTDLLQLAIQDIKQGNLKAGKMGLARIIDAAPGSIYAEKAWIWMSATFNEPDEKRICLENALKINPDNVTAQKGLAKLPPPALPEMVNEAPAFEDPAWLIEDDVDDERTFSSGSAPKTRQIDDPIQKTPQVQQKNDEQLLDEYIARQTAKGWQIISRTHTSVQLRKPKQWSNILLVLGLILLCLYGAGLIVLLLALVDYLLQKEQVVFVTASELRARTNPNTATGTRGPIATIVLATIIFAAVVLVFSLLMSLIVLFS